MLIILTILERDSLTRHILDIIEGANSQLSVMVKTQVAHDLQSLWAKLISSMATRLFLESSLKVMKY